MNKVALWSITALAAFLLVMVALFFITSESEFGEKKVRFEDLGGDFTLISKDGEVSLSDFKGKVVVMYFGFMTCPEVCPQSMTVISSALARLNQAELNATQAILVSVDPNRDTPERLEEYTQFYHSNLIGLTGTTDDIDRVTTQYGAYYDIAEIASVTQDYGVEHSSRYYVIDRQGKLVGAMRHSTTPNELYTQILELLEQEG